MAGVGRGAGGLRALVTGGRGFAGSWLAKALLEARLPVTSLDRDGDSPSGLELQGIAAEVNDTVGELRDQELVAKLLRDNAVDSVFHLAAQAIVGDANSSPIPTFRTNIEGTWVVLEACRQTGVERVVVASSDKAYGPHEQLPYTEDSALQPVFPYDVSKAAADLVARSYWHTYGLPVAVTRFANLYGGGDRNFSRLIPGDGHRGSRRPPSDDSLRRLTRARLPPRRGRGERLPRAGRCSRLGSGRRRGLQRGLGPASPGPRGGRADLRVRARTGGARLPRDRQSHWAKSTASTSTRPRSASRSAGSRRSICATESLARSTGMERTRR